ncbi:tRNA A64-2'-O-ribosylphosphate transferase [Heracleum sosnowskyi]|uniref:tRNA A64-2'-O-ribosylphosphate transferase n=1 Tax=Heracleum sosnowskyi TaxID=360622 RepID=A0AAD8LY39_9APIA|nr:tRNA A64-2'-O-ribosylphosphate transferase [Heracleum sosnowskyi]
MGDETILNIYKASRSIKKRHNSLYNALCSIFDDSIFVGEIAQLWPELPLVANLRCGLWYSDRFEHTCYFKSTDGHTNNLSFNTSRLNLHLAVLAGQKGGCIIVDSTRKGKRFPDSMSKTIPIWTCVMNRAILNHRKRMCGSVSVAEDASNDCKDNAESTEQEFDSWDCSLHLPLWVPPAERMAIENHLEEWTKQLETSGADITPLLSVLKKPLRPLWISQKSVIWLNEVPEHDSWDFTPLILVSASSSSGYLQQRTASEFSWNYIPGAGDDEESWARGLTPELFWNNAIDLINSGPDQCNQKVADIVEKDRVYQARRGYDAPQVSLKYLKFCGRNDNPSEKLLLDLKSTNFRSSGNLPRDNSAVCWLGSSNIAVCATQLALNASNVDSILNCDQESFSSCLEDHEACMHLPIVNSKFDRFSLLRNLPSAVSFAQSKLAKGKKLLVFCNTGEDISICVCLAILTSLFTVEGCFDDGESFSKTCITKLEMRQRLIYICKFAVNARPSRGNLKQVFNFLNRGSSS